MTVIPSELVHKILDYHAADSRSLKACSLVCREWVFRSRSHLFETCSLWPSKILGFCDLLQSPNCTLIPHVRTIRDLKHYGPQDYYSFNKIAADLGRLPNVRELEMTLTAIYRPEEIVPFLRAAFSRVTRITFTFAWQRLPLVSIICLFPALQELHIRGAGTPKDTPADAVPPQDLRSVTLSDQSVGPILAWLDAMDHLPKVHSLKLPHLHRSDVPIVCAALQRLAGSLHHLEFAVDALTVLDLSLHPNLRTLHISDASWAYCDTNQMIPLMTKLVAPALEHLTLELDLGLTVYQSLNWAALDAFLSSAGFPLPTEGYLQMQDT
ncbi:Cytoplasmic protein [Mycena venus]|uniref:Cytoplasmic protein n=1 Tax=Mycena venus TaxID=2733690 RepID=A0A8H6YXL7_9AGAR|nr:Cytoplasmic protein [Mycena venus]